MIESTHFKRLGDGRRQRADNGRQRVEGRGQRRECTKQVVRWQEMAAEEAEGSREQNREATHVNTHRCLGQNEGHTPQDHTEGREWRAEGRGHALGTQQAARVQQIATDNTRGHRTSPDV